MGSDSLAKKALFETRVFEDARHERDGLKCEIESSNFPALGNDLPIEWAARHSLCFSASSSTGTNKGRQFQRREKSFEKSFFQLMYALFFVLLVIRVSTLVCSFRYAPESAAVLLQTILRFAIFDAPAVVSKLPLSRTVALQSQSMTRSVARPYNAHS